MVLGSIAEAEDAAQEAYTRAWLRWSRLRGYEDPEAWVRTVAFRVAMSSWHKAKNRLTAHRRSAGGPAEAAHVPGLSPDRLVVVDALRRIPAEQRRALVLFHLLGLTVAEIADETGAPAGTVKARLSRGRKALAPYVSEFADDTEGPSGPAPTANAATRTTKKGMVSGA